MDLDAGALHLAIMSATWDIPSLHRLLSKEGPDAFWQKLTRHMSRRNLPDADHRRWKSTLKHGVYALGYGGGDGKIAEQIEADDAYELFSDHNQAVRLLKEMPEMAELFEAKSRMLKKVSVDDRWFWSNNSMHRA